ncbi:hypothetical protein [Endozoicomonas sp. 8E]|uniref:hypothetical protein n=1 Tax=Endozoicomonas sp. 8E TaxID=3035692 RepID=UPI00293949FA|nr:hypothetical protein [Endozoicomonas sp. 8E]WOG29917.1 hypothetical protein P6910_09750 [Endozoicomonas sp. 8E]
MSYQIGSNARHPTDNIAIATTAQIVFQLFTIFFKAEVKFADIPMGNRGTDLS